VRHGGDDALDLSGLDEVSRNISVSTWLDILLAATVPLQVLAFALPLSLAIPLTFMRATAAALDDDQLARMRAVAWTCLVALLIGAVARVINPRYMFSVLPLLCPLAGAAATAWARSADADTQATRLRQVLTVFAIILPCIAAGLAWMTIQRSGVFDLALAAAASVAALIGVWTVLQWVRVRPLHGCAGMVAMLLPCSFAFAAFKNVRLSEISSRDAGLRLREAVGEGAIVTAGEWVMNGPELFFYAGVEVDFRSAREHYLWSPREFTTDRWLVLHSNEWKHWEHDPIAARLSHVEVLPTRGRNAMLAWYDAP
jgi:hypothetical protein